MQNIQYKTGILYREKVKICDNIKGISLMYNGVEETIRVNLKIGTYENTITYAIESKIELNEKADSNDGFIEI